ncbi:LuxR C-terminal-related transcriptional regulator [Streptomyces sp. NPDC006197]|uniref:LuxR C-terminal-related transcriptional regulator n=1 Tax=Streptomyces sp. NPDC006197 TaxID=3156685 RepID=UPI0033AB0C82
MFDLLGLDDIAQAVYEEMLKDPAASAVTIAWRLDRPAAQVRNAMTQLNRLSLIRPSWQDPGEYRAVEPEVGLGLLLSTQEADLRRRQEEIEASRLKLELLAAQYAEFSRSREDTGTERLSGIDAIRLRIEALAACCSSEIIAFVPGGAQSRANMEASRPLDESVLARGVRMRSVYLESIANDRPTMEYVRWLGDSGAHIRFAAVLPPRMVIYDREVAIIPDDPDATHRGALVTRSKGVVSALCELFEQVWSAARPLDEASWPGDEDGLTLQEHAVLDLLAQGHADDQISRRLGISVRTTRRITAGLAHRLGAKSRFQTGALAALRGWLDTRRPAV